MTTIYAPNPHFYLEENEVVWQVSNELLTAEIEDARKHLAKAIETKGADYVYITDTEANPSAAIECLYLRYDKIGFDEEEGYPTYVGPKGPSCIVGHVMVFKGIGFDRITPCEGDNAGTALSDTNAYRSPIVREALNQAQSKQDHANGYTWGQAVEEFEAFINERTVQTS